MKVLVATRKGQGLRDNDFCFTKEGELVHYGFECTNEKIDGRCGCKRSLGGMDSLKATTTFTVEERDLTEAEYLKTFLASLKRAGWGGMEKWVVRAAAKDLLRIANKFKAGTILEKRGHKICERKVEPRNITKRKAIIARKTSKELENEFMNELIKRNKGG